jgi:hypothetical protein
MVRTLWRVDWYFLPGLPRPTISHGFLDFWASTAKPSVSEAVLLVDIDADGAEAKDEI